MKSAVLCADIGTSSIKTALVNHAGEVLSYARIRFPEKNPSWFDSFILAAKKLAGDCPQAVPQGICISGNGPTLVSDTGRILLWNENPDKKLAESITQNLKGTAAQESLFIPRLGLFKEIYPDDWNKSTFILSGPEYLIWQLTGNATTILPEKRYNNIYWTDESLSCAGIPVAKMPPFAMPGTLAGKLEKKTAVLCGLQDGLPVFCGAPDFIAALIGTNTLTPGSLCDRAGSSEGINLCARHPKEFFPAEYLEGTRVLPSIIPGLYNISVLIPDSGKTFGKIKQTFAPSMDYEDFVKKILGDCEFCPEGKRAMDDIIKLVAKAFAKLQKICAYDGNPCKKTVRTTGGQAKNQHWLQYKANATGISFQVTGCPDAELIGDAVLGFYGLGYFSSIQQGAEELVKTSSTYNPEDLQ